jgi:hypothetical protein
MDEQIDKLTHKGGWAWCIDGGHPSARFYLESNGTAWFEEWNGPNPSADELTKGIPAAVCEDVFKNLHSEKTNLLRFSSTNRLDWSFQPLARCVVLRSLSDSDVLYYLYVDPGYDEFYVHSPRGTGYLRGSCGFNLGNDLPERYKYSSNGFTTPCFPQHAISSGSNDKIGRRLVLSGIALLDPFESSRRYSSILEPRRSRNRTRSIHARVSSCLVRRTPPSRRVAGDAGSATEGEQEDTRTGGSEKEGVYILDAVRAEDPGYIPEATGPLMRFGLPADI